MKYFTYIATFMAIAAFIGGVALAQPYGSNGGVGPCAGAGPYGGPGGMMGWHYGPGHGYYSGAQIDRGKVDAVVKEALRKATLGERWTSPGGVKMTPILVDGQIEGQLWRAADMKTLTLGSYWAGPWGINAQLIENGAVAGMMWVKVQ